MPVRIACFAMSDANHFSSYRELVFHLVQQGAEVCVWTDPVFRPQVQTAGATFANLFDGRPLDAVDDTSRPFPARHVTFAGVHGRPIAEEVREWGPDLVVFESFSYIGRVVAELLGLKWVPHLAGGYLDGAATRAQLPTLVRTSIDPRCHAAVERIRSEYNIADASPFAYVTTASPYLNIAAVPEQWYTPAQAAELAPLAFFGCLESALLSRAHIPKPAGAPLRIYAAMGTIIWRYWTREALETLRAVRNAVATRPDASAVFGLGHVDLSEEQLESLRGPNVRIERFADQPTELANADIFVSHMGAGGTHEAVALGVPILSHPFFWDQPEQAKRAAEFGVAIPLAPGALGTDGAPSAAQVLAGIAAIEARRHEMSANLLRARDWEVNADAGRPAVARRIIALANS